MRETAPTEEEAWTAASTMAKAAAFYGLQDAVRKRRASSLNSGAWAGALIEAHTDGVYKFVSNERWEKVQLHVSNLEKWFKQDQIDRKALEHTRGYLVYVTLTYGSMTPYLKGIHLTLESWRLDRD
ncbi:hypothetical protein ACA910_019223 [Epithemia clementina (nom. ined.)]